MGRKVNSASTLRRSDGGKLSVLGPLDDGKFAVWDHDNAEELCRKETFKLAVGEMLKEAQK